MPISEADALKVHEAIHDASVKSVTLTSGETLKVEKNSSGCRTVRLEGFNAAEQNKSKPSDWAKKAKGGTKITWFLGGRPWGRIVDGVIEDHGSTIETGSSGAAKAKAKAKPKESSAAGAPAKKKGAPEAATAASSSSSAPAGSSAAAPRPPAKKPKLDVAPPVAPAAMDASDPLGLAPLFTGKGHGAVWEGILRPVLEAQPNAADFIGPARDKRIVPVRELTFQALKPNPPSGWQVVSLGQSPYPRIESATGIAHFDNALSCWEDKRFGSIVTMRCIIKAAAMGKYGFPRNGNLAELRALLKEKGCVGPAEWFQAMLAQGVLLMNASCTLLRPDEDKSVRASEVLEDHLIFWTPAITAVVDAILSECRKNGRGIVFAWWGTESLKTKKELQKACLKNYSDVPVEHIDWKNPAAMRDAFLEEPNIFLTMNKALTKLGLRPIDWLPTAGWIRELGTAASGDAAEMGDFIAETKELHNMYLERLRDGLDKRKDYLPDITGITEQPLVSLTDACKDLKLEAPATASVRKAGSMRRGELTLEEAGALHLYTTNFLYKGLNEALRHEDRSHVKQFHLYLKLLLVALDKLRIPVPAGGLAEEKALYRGVALDLRHQYEVGGEVTWWAVSSCTSDLKVAGSFSGSSARTLFHVTSHSCVPIREFSEYKSEEEFVLAPGTVFSVAKVEADGKGLIQIYLVELHKARRVR